jgi:hypothetical protein
LSAPPVAIGSPRRLFSLRDYWIVAGALSIALAIILALAGQSFVSSVLACFLLTLCAYPSMRYGTGSGYDVPAIPILSAAYGVQFALPVFFSGGTLWLVGGYHTVDPASIDAALLIAIVGFVAFLLVCYSRPVNQMVGKLPALNLHLKRVRALAYVLVFSVAVLGSSRYFATLGPDEQTTLSGLYRVVQNQLLVAIGILAWLTYTQKGLWMRLLYYALIAVAVVEGMSSGFLEAALAPVGVMFAAQWIYQRRLNKALAAACVAALLLLNPVKADFRNEIWFSAGESASAPRKALLWIESGIDFWTDVVAGRSYGDDAALQLVRRTSMVDTVAHVYESTPEAVPYYLGETYSYFIYSLVPRVLWPEKPVTSANKTLAVDYGLTTEEGAERSTFGISLLGEGYANFGWFGSTLAMVVVALALLVLMRLFADRESGPGGYAVFFAFFIFFLNGLGSSAEILLGNILQGTIASYILLYGAIERRPRRSGAES